MKVLIIDDEPNVREGLKLIIPWEAYGFEICGEGRDGIEGLEKILKLNPDLVMIDIKMPGRSGIEVIEEARKKGYRGKVMITTGYSDFDYAKKAMSLGVYAYILKPIDEEELMEELHKLTLELKSEAELQSKLGMGEQYLHRKQLKKLITHHLTQKELEAEFYRAYEKVYLVLFNFPYSFKRMEEVLEEMKAYFLEQTQLEFFSLQNQIIFLMKAPYEKQTLQRLKTLIKKLKLRYEIRITAAISHLVEQPQDLAKAYERLQKLLEKAFLFPEKLLFEEKVEQQEAQPPIIDTKEMTKQLFALIQVADQEKLKQTLDEVKLKLKKSTMGIKGVMSLCLHMTLMTLQLVGRQYEQYEMQVPKGEVIIEKINQCEDLNQIIEFMKQCLGTLCQLISMEGPENTMEKILYYISNNYNKELKLEKLAQLFNYNSAYLGKSFKNYTGESFNVYIDRLRINKAKALLLNEDLKVYQISKEVGYKHIDYFHSKFKKYVGLSPLEYRKSKAQ